MRYEHPLFTIKEYTQYGRGLYATTKIEKGHVIHTCEIILLSEQETRNADALDILANHRFAFSRFQDAVLLGYGSLFNGLAIGFNVSHKVIFEDFRPMVQFSANRDIEPGEQLFIEYTYNPEDLDEKGTGSLQSDRSVSKA